MSALKQARLDYWTVVLIAVGNVNKGVAGTWGRAMTVMLHSRPGH